jgi:broad specificity phosphatase PhoE
MDLYLVRHGESDIPHDTVQSDYPLSALGREQALRVAERFRGLAIDHLISTPYKRTLETARAIAEATGTAVIEEPGLGAVDAGRLATTPYSQRRERWPEYFANPSPLQDYRAFGGEGPAEFYERVTGAFVERI